MNAAAIAAPVVPNALVTRAGRAPEIKSLFRNPHQDWSAHMDMKDAAAMTEASGLTDDQGGMQQTSSSRSGPGEQRGAFSPQLRSPSSDTAKRWADRLREVTMKAPLRSLLVAFLAGAWIARRR